MIAAAVQKLKDHTPAEIARAVTYRLSSTGPALSAERWVALQGGAPDAGEPGDTTLVIATAGNGNIGDQAMFETILAVVDGPVVAFVPSDRAFTMPDEVRDRVTTVVLGDLVNGGTVAAARARKVFSGYLRDASTLIVIGADIMDGGYQRREAALRLDCLELAERAGLDCRIVGFSWSAEPDPYVLRQFRGLPGGIRKFVRDGKSLDRISADGVAGVEGAADVVFSHSIAPEESAFSRWAGERRSAGHSVIVVNVSGLVFKRLARQGGGDRYLQDMADTVRRLVAQGHAVALMPHVVRSGDDDLDACRRVAGLVTDSPGGGAGDDRVLLVDRLLSPAEVLALVGASEAVISARMHLGILTLTTSRPCVLFDTQGKVEGLMREFGLSDCVISPDDCSADGILRALDRALEVSQEEGALSAGLDRMRSRSALNFAGAGDVARPSALRIFADTAELQTHSGIYPADAVEEAPRLTGTGEYSDPRISDDALEAYARIAACGPLREPEDQIAEDLFAGQDGALEDADIGWYTDLLTGHVADDETRLASSSGGLATALLEELLESGEITGVIHMCPSESGPLFGYRMSRTVAELRRGARTRYYPGSLFDPLEEVRQEEGRYAVVGIPSFISELRRLENEEPVLKERIRVHVGLVCGHQKSANYATYLAWQAGIEPGDLVGVDFRAKVPGKPANDYSTRFRYRSGDGTVAEKLVGQDALEGTNWGLGMFKSNFSDFTDDAFNETADVVFGDAWLPRFTADYMGTNIVIVRDGHLGEVLQRMESRGTISLEDCSATDILGSQTSLLRHTRREIGYRLSWFRRKGLTVPVMNRDLPAPSEVDVLRKGIQRQRSRISRTSHVAFTEALDSGSLRRFTVRMAPLTTRYRVIDRMIRLEKKAKAKVGGRG
ncbi:Coenzyme F420 hydrogenase/dehydrogenase, beta subunit C-terminal domain [Corynebacterium variabile]|uniref:Coenzyme F420 hydrogenase/dehydrogenase, beta subunit C-terminal domain n=1 Tax=Corynebacterium variabile TaxID=1727 RepID=UPI0028A822CA|nr:Coenzyme F420 hydrogenase/dehydrogenase, beta subunit C-terminal domain [Corynebacterium variabile]